VDVGATNCGKWKPVLGTASIAFYDLPTNEPTDRTAAALEQLIMQSMKN